MSEAVQETWRALSMSMSSLAPDREWIEGNQSTEVSCDIMHGVVSSGCIECRGCLSVTCVRMGPKVATNFETIERIVLCQRYREGGHIWIERGTRVVLVLSKVAVIGEEQQSVSIGNSMHLRNNM